MHAKNSAIKKIKIGAKITIGIGKTIIGGKMRKLLLILVIISTGCIANFDKKGQLRQVAIARNVYTIECKDCDYTVIDTTESQSNVIKGSFDSISELLHNIFSAIIPAGFSKK